MLAGRDTTAALLTSLFQLLATHPDVEDRLINEIDDKLRGEMPSHENVGQLKFADAVFTESLRLFPSGLQLHGSFARCQILTIILHRVAPLDFRKALNDDVLPDGTPVPAGTEVKRSFCLSPTKGVQVGLYTQVQYLPWVMGRDKKHYVNPDSFVPQR